MNPLLKKLSPTATNMIRMDHTHVLATFHQYEADTHPKTKQALVNTVAVALEIHSQLEEEIFYPAVRDAIEEQNLVDEAEVEHASAKDLVEQIEAMGPGDALYDAKVKVLGEYVKHHIREEEDELFPAVELSELDLQDLGTDLQERKKELEEELGLEFAS